MLIYALLQVFHKLFAECKGTEYDKKHNCAIFNKYQHGELYFEVKSDETLVGQAVTEESL